MCENREVAASPGSAAWTEPDDWQDPRPALFTREDAVYVSDPATKQVHLIDLAAGAVAESVTLEREPKELSGAVGHHHH